MIAKKLIRKRIIDVHLVSRRDFSKSSVMSSKNKRNSFLIDEALIDGQWIKTSSTYPVISPFNNQICGQAAECNETHLQNAIDSSKLAFKTWSLTTAKERSSLIYRLYELQLKYKDELAELITLEMGKPINEAKGEIIYGSSFLQWFSEQAKRIHG